MTNVTRMPTSEELELDKALVDYILGNMSDKDKATFEEKMANDPKLKAQVDKEKQLKDNIVNAIPMNDVNFETPNVSVNVLEITQRKRASESLTDTKPRKKISTLPSLQWFAASAAVFVVTLFVFNQLSQEPIAEYEGLSSDSAPIHINNTDRHYVIVFGAALNDAQRTQIAHDMNFEIVSGPGAGNSYVIQTKQSLSSAELDQWLAHPSIDFLEPSK